MYRKIFCTFADSRMNNSLSRLKSQAEGLDFFDKIFINNEENLDKDFCKYFKNKLIRGSRGYGFWVWKPQIVLQTLNKMHDGDIMLYADAGCHLNKKGLTRLNYYFDQADLSESGILAFQENKGSSDKNLTLSNCIERFYTKGDIFDFFKTRDLEDVYNTGQIIATTFLIKKTKTSEKLIKEWLDVFKHNFHLTDDSPSTTPDLQGFIENRHDQSIFSILCKKSKVKTLSSHEMWQDDWKKLDYYPIQAKRDKDLNIYYKLKQKIHNMKKSINRTNLIDKIKRNTHLYQPIRKVYYFIFFNNTLGKLMWAKARYMHKKDSFAYTPCLCRENTYTTYVDYGKHKVISCLSCGLLRNYPEPDNGIYEEDMSIEYDVNSDLSIQVIDICNRLQEKEQSDINILDFGCGDGRAMMYLKEIGFKNVYGLEISKYLSNKAKSKNLSVFEDIHEVPAELKFDYIIANHVFEHIKNLDENLDEIKSILKRDGKIIAFVPNIRSISMRNKHRNLLWNSHYWQFTPNTFKQLFERNSLEVLECKTMSDKSNKILKIETPSEDGKEGDVVYVIAKKTHD